MRKLTFIILIFMGILTPWNFYGQTSMVGKSITLPTGQVRLKTLLTSLSNQTGYVFSYDASKINDKKLIFIDKSNVKTLEAALTNILPSDIRYKRIDKYIVLYKKSSKIKPDTTTFAISEHLEIKDIKRIPTDTITDLSTILSDTVPFIHTKTSLKSSKADSIQSQRQMSIETTYNKHLMHLSLLMGTKTFYGKASVCYDYHESYHVGLGVGMNVNFTPSLGISADLSQYALVLGKTRKMDINTYTTELNPLVSYAINKKIKLKVGPSVYWIQSNLSTKNKKTNLGSYLGCNATIGLQISLL